MNKIISKKSRKSKEKRYYPTLIFFLLRCLNSNR